MVVHSSSPHTDIEINRLVRPQDKRNNRSRNKGSGILYDEVILIPNVLSYGFKHCILKSSKELLALPTPSKVTALFSSGMRPSLEHLQKPTTSTQWHPPVQDQFTTQTGSGVHTNLMFQGIPLPNHKAIQLPAKLRKNTFTASWTSKFYFCSSCLNIFSCPKITWRAFSTRAVTHHCGVSSFNNSCATSG